MIIAFNKMSHYIYLCCVCLRKLFATNSLVVHVNALHTFAYEMLWVQQVDVVSI